MSNKQCFVAALAIILVLGLTSPAIAHHSFAMYDMQKSQSMSGKLTRFIPGGNHAQLVFEVLGDDGQPLKKDGKVVSISTRVISKDGKEMTVTPTGKNEKGQTIRSELLLERK